MLTSHTHAAERSRRSRIGLWLLASLTGLVGVVNLLSAVTPNFPDRTAVLKELFVPFEVRAGGHIFAALAGFVLLTLATNLLRRKRVAWLLTVGLLLLSIVSHLIKGLDYEESLLAVLVLLPLWRMRGLFTAQSDRPSVAQGLRVLVGALLFTLAYGTAGFYLLDSHYHTQFSLPQAVVQTLAMFFTEDNAGLQPRTRFGLFFANSIYTVGSATLAIAVVMLLRPILWRGAATSEERQRAAAIAAKHGTTALARMALFEDKAYYFSPSGESVIAYVAKGRGAVALGDPIGPLEDRQEAIVGFQQFCERNDWYPAFYQAQPQGLDLYRILGFQAVQIGEEAIVDLQTFTLQGKAAQNLRTPLNRLKKQGYQVHYHEPPLSDDLLHRLKAVSDEWLQMMHGAEKRFSVGWFDFAYLRECVIVSIETPEGEICAFANVISQYQASEVTVDLMRRRAQVEPGTMEVLFVSLFQYFKDRGYGGFNLGLSALSGVGKSRQPRRVEQALSYLYEHLNRFYNFKGLHSFKEKFHPHWEPRYLVYPGLVALPDIAVALVRADSGDRLLDYLKPGS